MTSLEPSLPPISPNIYSQGYREKRTESKLPQSSKHSFEQTWVFSSRDHHWENKRDCLVKVYDGIILRHLDFVYCTWLCFWRFERWMQGVVCMDLQECIHFSASSTIASPCWGTAGELGHRRGRLAHWDDRLSSPRKYAEWEGLGEPRWLRELVLDNGSFLGEGKGFC